MHASAAGSWSPVSRYDLNCRGPTVRRRELPPQFIDGPIQRLAVDKLHRVVMDAPFDSDGIHGHDVRMVKLSRRLGLVLEAGNLPRIQDRGKREHLQGHAAPSEIALPRRRLPCRRGRFLE